MSITAPETRTPADALRLLSDPTRLRILALLEQEELAVGELSRALDLAQSRVSNHLRLLREAGLLRQRRVGTSTFLRLDLRPEAQAIATRLWSVLRAELETLPEYGADRVRLDGILAERRERNGDFFDRVAGQWDKLAGAFSTGRSRERAVAQLLPAGFVVADLGCGTGYMAEALLSTAARVICVDRSERMLEEARARLTRRAPHMDLEFRQGRLDALPIADGELDALVCGLVLHHLESLDAAVAEMARVLKPGGSAAVLELSPHTESWMRRELGDLHLGVPANETLEALEGAGFTDLVLDPTEDHYCPRRSDHAPGDVPVSLSLYVVRGRKPQPRTTPAPTGAPTKDAPRGA